MKSVVLSGIRKMEVREEPVPQLTSENQVLLRVGAVGVCGSDIHYFTSGRIGDQVVQFPFKVGHECAAVVEEIGKEVSELNPGDWVVLDPAVVCGECDQCLNGRFHTCRHLRFLGCPGQLEGCLSEFITMSQDNCCRITKGKSLALGILVEPLSIGIYGIKLLEDSTVNSIGILGSGPIGLSTALAARETGISKIYMTDKLDFRLDAARKTGAVWTGNPNKTDVVNQIQNQEPFGLDAVIECCGDQEALDQAVDLLKPGGKLLITGIPEQDRIAFDACKIRRKEICIQNVRRQNKCIPAAIEYLESGRVDMDFMLTHSFHADETQEAFELVEDYGDGVIKALIRFD